MVLAAVKLHENRAQGSIKAGRFCDSEWGTKREGEMRGEQLRVTLTPSTHIQNRMTEQKRRKGGGERREENERQAPGVQKVSGPVCPVINHLRQAETVHS